MNKVVEHCKNRIFGSVTSKLFNMLGKQNDCFFFFFYFVNSVYM